MRAAGAGPAHLAGSPALVVSCGGCEATGGASSPTATDITFFLADDKDLGSLRGLDPDEAWRTFSCGQYNWVLQTYLRLARAGVPVELSDRLPQRGLAVFHARQRRSVMAQGRPPAGVILVGLRGDNRDPLIADFEVLQNGHFADGRRRFFVPHWPQPGLLPREPGRGATIRRIEYKGWTGNLDPGFQTPEWERFLGERGIEWRIDGANFSRDDERPIEFDWRDYRSVDLLLSVRPPRRRHRYSKPASKLYNAWLAGVPALLGPEYALREIRRSSLDYVEVTGVEEAKDAVRRLTNDPELYQAMVRHGFVRAAEYRVEATLERWIELLTETIPALARDGRLGPTRRLPFEGQRALRRIGALFALRATR